MKSKYHINILLMGGGGECPVSPQGKGGFLWKRYC